MSAVAPAAPPQWDLTTAYPSLDSPEFSSAFAEMSGDIMKLGSKLEAKPGEDELEEFVKDYNDLLERVEVMRSYIYGFVAVDTRNDEAQARASQFEAATVPLSKLDTDFATWVGSVDLGQAIAASEYLRAHEFALRKYGKKAKHLMSPAEEALAAELAPSAALAWEKLHGNVTSQMETSVPGRDGAMPISAVRNLAYNPDRTVRKAAYEAELAAFKANEIPLAAAMNSIKAHVQVLCDRRKWQSPLDEALFNANGTREALDAMMAAAKEAYPDLRRYLHAKAKALKLPQLAWYDMFAPVSSSSKEWPYEDGTKFVADQFHRFSGRMGEFAERAYAHNWIDVGSRPGKVDGAFCMGFIGDESRILLNYSGSFSNVNTLAHELGHGYHNLCLSGKTPMQKDTPMTLAETASIFCELVILNAALKEGSEAEQLAIVESSLMRSCQTVVDISSRYLFESQVFENRKERELSPTELCDAMLMAQSQTYGDGIDENTYHPYMWAVKPHYYSSYSFYNFPYMFGLLFATGLYAIYEREPESFKGKYDELLGSTGLEDAHALTSRFGIDIQSIEFWRGSLDIIRREVDLFEKLIG